jgi:hypothetical protein
LVFLAELHVYILKMLVNVLSVRLLAFSKSIREFLQKSSKCGLQKIHGYGKPRDVVSRAAFTFLGLELWVVIFRLVQSLEKSTLVVFQLKHPYSFVPVELKGKLLQVNYLSLQGIESPVEALVLAKRRVSLFALCDVVEIILNLVVCFGQLSDCIPRELSEYH